MSFLSSMDIAGSALSAQRTRMDIISQNIANATTTKTEDGTPYRRQMVVFQEKQTFDKYLTDGVYRRKLAGVRIAEVVKDETPLTPVYNPEHPDADEDGYIYMPNVDNTKEQLDLMTATDSYTASLSALSAIKVMTNAALEIGR